MAFSYFKFWMRATLAIPRLHIVLTYAFAMCSHSQHRRDVRTVHMLQTLPRADLRVTSYVTGAVCMDASFSCTASTTARPRLPSEDETNHLMPPLLFTQGSTLLQSLTSQAISSCMLSTL